MISFIKLQWLKRYKYKGWHYFVNNTGKHVFLNDGLLFDIPEEEYLRLDYPQWVIYDTDLKWWCMGSGFSATIKWFKNHLYSL